MILMNKQIMPHGGQLLNLTVTDSEKAEIRQKSGHWKRIILTSRQQKDLLLLATGVYSPLRGFMGKEDYQNVLNFMHLQNNILWSLPITLSVDRITANRFREGEEAALVDERGKLLASLLINDIFSYDKQVEAKQVYGTTDTNHPGVYQLYCQEEMLLGGNIKLVDRPALSFQKYHYDPLELRHLFQSKGWKTVVAFQTRNPIHRAHEYIQKCALETTDGLLIHPLIGESKEDDLPVDLRMRSYEVILEKYYPSQRSILGVFPAAMRYAGPREAVFHAICRKNYGCSHIIIGRDHAGAGNYYGPYDAQALLKSISSEELGIIPLFFEETFYCKRCGNMASAKTCPHTQEDRVILSGTRVREMLSSREALPAEFTRPEVSEILQAAYTKKFEQQQSESETKQRRESHEQ